MSDRPVRIAVLFPSTGLIDGEICDLAEARGAEALIFKVSPKGIPDSADVGGVAAMTQEMGTPDLLAKVAAQARDVDPDVVVWACTSGSFLGIDARRTSQVDAMSGALGGIPATTTSLAIVAALRRKSIKHVAAVTPYHALIGHKFVGYLRDNGFVVDGEAHAGCGSDSEVGALSLDDLVPLVRMAVRPTTQAIAIPCTALRQQNLELELARMFDVAVILANAATLDEAVRIARAGRARSRRV
jgi:maleate cis-trans isomerase